MNRVSRTPGRGSSRDVSGWVTLLVLALVAAHGCPPATAATRTAAGQAGSLAYEVEAYLADDPLPVIAAESSKGGGGGADELARKLQNPLANIKALMTDNTIALNTGVDKGTSFAFQLQPVYAIDMPDRGFTFIPRAVLPIMGLEPGTDRPNIGQPGGGSGRAWGLGDSALQAFIAPHSDAKWKWGVGPQLSLPTATDARLRGAGWGAGIAGVVTGEITPDLSASVIVGNLWSFNRDFNTFTFQPMLTYNVPGMPGVAISYNAVISADWEAPSNNTWTVPLGASVSKMFELSGGKGFDLAAGVYYNVVRPDGAANWQIRFGLTWIFP